MSGQSTAGRPRVIIDCDPGHDDALAIMVAARHCDVLGITTVSGNAPLDRTQHNARVVADLIDLDVPIHAGADRPLVVSPRHATHIHGRTGLDGPRPRDPIRELASTDAVSWLIDTLRSEPDVWLVPVGPLTNIALAIRQAPDIVDRVRGVSIMGGAARGGNVTAVGEFNIWADPHAAAAVFTSGLRPIMVGLDTTRQLTVSDDEITALRALPGETAHFAADVMAFYLDRQFEATGIRAGAVHDVCAVLAVTHPHLLDLTDRHVAVETDGRHTRGMTVVDERPRTDDVDLNAQVAYGIDAGPALEVLMTAIGDHR